MHELVSIYQKNPSIKKLNLMFKNLKDITLMTNILSKFKCLQEITFHGNKITTLPSLQLVNNLAVLDLSNNPIQIDDFALDALYNMKSLRHLSIDCTKQQQKVIIQNLPNLITLNNQPIFRPKIQKQTFQQQLQILQSKLSLQMQKTKQTYTKMTKMLKSQSINRSQQGRENESKNYDQQFDFLFKEIKEEMEYFYSGLDDKLSSEGVFAYCKNKLSVVYDNLMIKLLDQLGNQHIIKIYEQLSKIKSQNFQYILKIIFSTSYQQHIDEQFNQSTNRLRKQTLYQNQIFKLKKQILELKQNKYKNHIQEDYHQIVNDKFKNYKLDQYYHKEKDKEKQNNYYQDIKIHAHTPRINQKIDLFANNDKQKNSIMKMSKTMKNISKSPSNANIKVSSSSKNLNKSPSNAYMKASPSSRNLNKSPSKSYINKMNQTISSKALVKQVYSSKQQLKQSQSLKITNLDQLLKLIDQIMRQKRKDNEKNLYKKQIFNTSQQRYGLKEVALQWSLCLIKAIQLYHKQSIQVQIFAKILKNTLYQQYYDQMHRFNLQINKHLSINHGSTKQISQQSFKKVLIYFFNIQSQQYSKITKNIAYPINITSLYHFLQTYKLNKQQKYLYKFRCLFQKIDEDEDGCLNKEEVKELIKKIKINSDIHDEQQKVLKETLITEVTKIKKEKFIFSQIFQIMHTIL